MLLPQSCIDPPPARLRNFALEGGVFFRIYASGGPEEEKRKTASLTGG